MNLINPDRSDILINTLACLWEESVRSSHSFLKEKDIQELVPFVRNGLEHVETLVVNYQQRKPAAFLGIEAVKIEMLFVAPAQFGRGIGKELVRLAVDKYKIRYVDVNEQNPTGTGFYRHLGFEVFDRSGTDEQGNPFPILKMRLNLNRK